MTERCTCGDCPECLPPGRVLIEDEDEDLAYELHRDTYEDTMEILDIGSGLKKAWDDETERLDKR